MHVLRAFCEQRAHLRPHFTGRRLLLALGWVLKDGQLKGTPLTFSSSAIRLSSRGLLHSV